MPRTLVAGFGNELRGDDGFGVAVVRGLERSWGATPDVELVEIGTAGVRLAQELMAGYDRLIVVDAMSRGGHPGALYVLEVEGVEPPAELDLHLAEPGRALGLARAAGVLPGRVLMVGCEAVETEELTTELTAPVAAAVGPAMRAIDRLLADPLTAARS